MGERALGQMELTDAETWIVNGASEDE